MAKVVKREVVLKKRASKMFTNPGDALIAFNELVELKKESEKSVSTPQTSVERRVMREGKEASNDIDSIGSYWNSVDVMDLTPTQRKHFKEIMRKEVRK